MSEYPKVTHFVHEGVVCEAVQVSPTTVEIRLCRCVGDGRDSSPEKPPSREKELSR